MAPNAGLTIFTGMGGLTEHRFQKCSPGLPNMHKAGWGVLKKMAKRYKDTTCCIKQWKKGGLGTERRNNLYFLSIDSMFDGGEIKCYKLVSIAYYIA